MLLAVILFLALLMVAILSPDNVPPPKPAARKVTDVQKPLVASVTTNVKNEANMNEWIEHHLRLGFARILIIDNISDEPVFYPDERVKVVRCETLDKRLFMEMALQWNRLNGIDWSIHVDGDEYIAFPKHPSIGAFLESTHSKHDAIALNWLCFGSNWLETNPNPGRLLPTFTRSEPGFNPHVKTLYRVRMAEKVGNPHYYDMKHGSKCVDANGNTWQLGSFNNTSRSVDDTAGFVAHYITQDYQTYYLRKIARPRDDLPTEYRRPVEREEHHQLGNQVERTIMRDLYC